MSIESVVPLDTNVLLVDDDPDISQALADLLEHEGYRVHLAGNGAEALDRAKRHQYVAVILDLGLPDIDGLDVLRQLLEIDQTLPVIVLTAYTAQEKTVGALTQGAFAFMTKPYNRDQIKATLSRAVSMRALATRAETVETALTVSEDRFRSVVQSASDAIVLANARGQVISWNKAAERLFGYAEMEVLGKALTMLMPARYHKAHQRGIERVRSTGQSQVIGQTLQMEGLRKDGTEFPIELSLATWRTLSETYYCGIIRDVTERRRTEAALQASEERYRALFEDNPSMYFMVDHTGRILSVNRFGAEQLGYTVAELVARPVLTVFYEADREAVTRNFQACLERVGHTMNWEFRKVRKDGSLLRVRETARAVRSAGKDPVVLIVCEDITEQKRAEEALQEQLRLATFGAELGIVLTRSRTLRDMLGLCTEAMVQHLDAAFARIWLLNQEGTVLELQASAGLYTHLDGPHSRIPVGSLKIGRIAQTRHPHLTNDVLHDPHISDREWAIREGMLSFAGYPLTVEDRVIGVVAMFARQPLTGYTTTALASAANAIAGGIERKQAEEALARLSHQQELILNSAGEGIYGLDQQGRTTFVNEAAARMLGLTVNELIGCPMHPILHHSKPDGSPYPEEQCPIYAALRDGSVHSVYNEVFWRKDGTSFPVEYVSTPIREHGKVVGAVIVFTDITERKIAEDALHESEELLRQVTENIRGVFWMSDVEKTRILYISPRYEEIWGRTCESLRASPRSWLEAIHPDDRRRVLEAALNQQVRGNYHEEYRIVRPDGSIRWIRDRAFPVRDASGTVYRIAGIAEDITHRKSPGGTDERD